MKFTGRILAILIAASLPTAMFAYIRWMYGTADWNLVVLIPVLAMIGWGLGEMYDKVKYSSEMDPLTETYNRRYLLDMFSRLTDECERKEEALAVFLVDVDKFKFINDSYGHLMGDEVLRQIPLAVAKVIEKRNLIVRWGGDEFLILLPGTKSNELLEHLQQRLDAELQTLPETLSVHVSVSIGFSVYPDEGRDLNKLIKQADRRMYRQKAKKANSAR